MRVPQEHLLESGQLFVRSHESNGPRTEPSDGASGDFQYVNTLIVHATLGVHGAMSKPQCSNRAAHGIDDRLCVAVAARDGVT